jgi:hypothetical protein
MRAVTWNELGAQLALSATHSHGKLALRVA